MDAHAGAVAGELADLGFIRIATVRAGHAVGPDARLNKGKRGGFIVEVAVEFKIR